MSQRLPFNSMSNKLLKCVLFSGLGLIGLTLALLGVGSAVASQQKAEMDALAQEFIEQLPAVETNDSAHELDRLAADLGLDPFGLYPSDRGKIAPEVDQQKAEAFEAIRDSLQDYLASQGQKTGGPLEPVPTEIMAFLAQHQGEFEAVKQHLATEEAPQWEQDPASMVDMSYMGPNFFSFSWLHRLLLVEAISHSQNKRPEAMRETLAIAQKLHEPVAQRPELLSYLASLIMAKEQAGVLRHLDGVPVALVERSLTMNRHASGQQALKLEAWSMYREMQQLADGITEKQQSGEDEKLNALQSIHLKWSAVDTARIMTDAYTQLESSNVCNSEGNIELAPNGIAWWNEVGQIALPNYGDQLTKGSRQMLELELTQKVLQAKAQREGGQWPEQLLGLESQVCSGESWVYKVTPEGKMSLSFSYGFDEEAAERFLPLWYEEQ